MRALELFAGIGGIALAEQMAGIEVVALSEIEDYPVRVLKKNFSKIPILTDVKKINQKSLMEVGIDPKTIDIISGGFPCQPFSVAGHRRGTKDDRDLWPEMFRIIKEIKPNWVVGENVANFANMELDRTLSDLESEGYQTRTFVLPAVAIGAPHQRMRTFIVANANSERWESVEKSKTIGRDWEHTKSFVTQRRQKKSWSTAVHILSTGAELLTNSSSRIWRNDDGLSEGMDRLKCLGNAVVPQQILPIFKTIVEIEKAKHKKVNR
jgi:DNA (cytosine-5)-methyltransferase 1